MNGEWRNCRKKPVVVQYRKVRPDEEGVETLEGFRPCDPDVHFVVKGVEGEEYPIEKTVFRKTYETACFRPRKWLGVDAERNNRPLAQVIDQLAYPELRLKREYRNK